MGFSPDLSRRMEFGLASPTARDELEGLVGGYQYSTAWYVDTVNGNDTVHDGRSDDSAFATVQKALDNVDDNDVIYVVGDVREEAEAVAGIQGVRIIGAAGGNTRHDNGVRWREPASGATTGGSLLLLRDQGWEVHNILFVPKSDGTAVELKRREDSTDPDASHAIIRGCKFIGAATATTIGVEDNGGTHHVVIEDCEFNTLNSAIVSSDQTISWPKRWVIQRNIFMDNTEHIDVPLNESVVQGNVFDEGTTNVEVDGADAGGNFVIDNYFQQDQANISNSDGYAGHSTDVWRNFSQNTAAMTVGVPS